MEQDSQKLLPSVVIIRHSKERKSKCSLQPLVGLPEFAFYVHTKPHTWKHVPDSDPVGVRLDFEGPLLSVKDAPYRLLVVDATWRYAQRLSSHPKIAACRPRALLKEWKTAYPRRQNDCHDPERGLASIEALFAAFLQMGSLQTSWLDQYHWKHEFLEKNAELIQRLCETKGLVC